MGHKGVSKRKPKQEKSKVGSSISSDVRPGESSSVQMLVKDNALPNSGVINLHTGSNKKGKKDKR